MVLTTNLNGSIGEMVYQASPNIPSIFDNAGQNHTQQCKKAC